MAEREIEAHGKQTGFDLERKLQQLVQWRRRDLDAGFGGLIGERFPEAKFEECDGEKKAVGIAQVIHSEAGGGESRAEA